MTEKEFIILSANTIICEKVKKLFLDFKQSNQSCLFFRIMININILNK